MITQTLPWTRWAAAGLLALTLLATAQAQDGERETRNYDIADLAPQHGSTMRYGVWDAGLFRTISSHFSPSEIMSDLDEMSVAQYFSGAELASLVSSIVYDVDEEASVDDVDQRLRVHATPEGQRLAQSAIEHLRRAAGTPIRVAVEELVLPSSVALVDRPDAATLAQWRRADLRGAGHVLGLSLDPGCWRLAEDVRGVRCVIDVDVELAQDSSIADPVVMRVETGARVLARAAPLMDGRVALRICAGAAELRGEPRRVAFAQDELGSVDLADLEASFVSTELVLSAGEAQTVVLARPGGAHRVLVFSLTDAPARAMDGTLRLFPYAALAANDPALRLSVGGQPWLDGRPTFGLAEVDGPPDASRLPNDEVRERLEEVIAREIDEQTAEISAIEWMLGGCFAFRASSEALDRVATRLRTLEDEWVRHARLDVQIVERRPESGQTQVIGRMRSPVPIGMPVALAAYRNAAYVADQDVEVAEKSRISDPLISSVVAGAFANVVVSAAGSSAYMVALELRVSEFAEPQLHPFSATDVGAMEQIVDRSVYAESRVRVARSRSSEILLGQSPFTDEPAWLVAIITVE